MGLSFLVSMLLLLVALLLFFTGMITRKIALSIYCLAMLLFAFALYDHFLRK